MRSVPHLHATTIATTRRRATTTRHRATTMHAAMIAGRRCQSVSASAITMSDPGMRSGLVTLSHRPATTSAHATTRAMTGQSLGPTIVVLLPQIVVLPQGMMTAHRRATRTTVTLITKVVPWHRRGWKPMLSCRRRKGGESPPPARLMGWHGTAWDGSWDGLRDGWHGLWEMAHGWASNSAVRMMVEEEDGGGWRRMAEEDGSQGWRRGTVVRLAFRLRWLAHRLRWLAISVCGRWLWSGDARMAKLAAVWCSGCFALSCSRMAGQRISSSTADVTTFLVLTRWSPCTWYSCIGRNAVVWRCCSVLLQSSWSRGGPWLEGRALL